MVNANEAQKTNDQVRSSSSEDGYCTVYTKFMENYRLSDPIETGKNIKGISKNDGNEEFVCLRTDGYIERFYPDKQSSTGYKNTKTNLQGEHIAAICDLNGNLLIFATQGAKLYYIKETSPGSGIFSQPSNISYTLPYDACNAKNLTVRQIGEYIWIAVLIGTSIDQNNYIFYGSWLGVTPTLENCFSHDQQIDTDVFCWSNSDVSDPLLLIGGPQITGIHPYSNKIHYYPDLPGESKCSSITSVYDCTRNLDIIAVTRNDSLYYLEAENGNNWVKINQEIDASSVILFNELNNHIHIFCLSKDGYLYHGYIPSNGNDSNITLSPIKSSIEQFSITEQNNGLPSIFAYNMAEKAVNYLILEDKSRNWNIQPIALPSDHNVHKYKCYSTEVTAYDSKGLVYTGAILRLWSSEKTRVEINGEVVMVGPEPENHIELKTSGNGVVSVTQETQSISVPELYIDFSTVANGIHKDPQVSNTVLAISQYAPIENELKNIDGNNLLNARKGGGQYLLAEKYRKQEIADSLASALRQCAGLIESPTLANLCTRSIGDGFAWVPANNIKSFRKINGNTSSKNNYGWCLRKEGQNILYSAITPEEIDMKMQELKSYQYNVSGWGFFSSIGDLVRAVAEKFVEVVEVAVKVVENDVTTVITYIHDKVKYVISAVVDTAQVIWDVVESIFNEVEVFFTDVFEWLGYIFNWDDILRTHDMIIHSLNQVPDFLTGAVSAVQSKLDSAITTLQNQVDYIFSNTIKQFQDISIADLFNIPLPETLNDVKKALSHNFVYNSFVQNIHSGPSITALSEHILDKVGEPVKNFMDILTEFTNDPHMAAAFIETKNYFSNLSTNADNIVNNVISGLLSAIKGIAQVALAGTRAVINALLLIVEDLIEIFKDLLNRTWDIPFLTSFCKWLTNGRDLNIASIISLMVAIPSTVAYKVIYKEAPFPDDSSIAKFKQTFTAGFILEQAGYQSESKIIEKSDYSEISDQNKKFLQLTSLTSFGLYGEFSGLTDAVKNCGVVLSLAVIATEMIGQVTGVTSVTDGWSAGLYGLGWLGVLIDLIFVKLADSIPENANDVGVIVATIYWIVYFLVGVMANFNNNLLNFYNHFFFSHPGMYKYWLLSTFDAITKNLNHPIVALLDILCYRVAFGLGIASLLNSDDSAATIENNFNIPGELRPV